MSSKSLQIDFQVIDYQLAKKSLKQSYLWKEYERQTNRPSEVSLLDLLRIMKTLLNQKAYDKFKNKF